MIFLTNKSFISEDRGVKLISDVDHLVTDELRKQFSLIDKIIETNKETFSSVYEKIEESGKSPDFISLVVNYAFKIRPLNTKSLLSLHSMLLKRPGYEKYGANNDELHAMLLTQGIICKNEESGVIYTEEKTPEEIKMMIFKEDDLDPFIKMSSELGFNAKSKENVASNSPIAFVNGNKKPSYLQIIAFYGAIKCFKHACLSNEYDFFDIEKYAIAGGNMEIVHILEQRNYSFENCLEVSIKYHRNELCDWILIHNKCSEAELLNSCSYYNDRAVAFAVINEIGKCDFISQAVSNGNLEIIKYLHETCHAEVPDDAISNASRNGHIDIVKYLYEQCRAEITEETIRNSKTEEIKNYFSSLFSDQPSDFESNIFNASSKGNLASVQYLFERYHRKIPDDTISIASNKGHFEVVRYLHETCHAEVPDDAIINASRNGHIEIVKYLYEQCHAKANDDSINDASRNGHLEVVRYLYEQCHTKVNDDAISKASRNGHIEVVRYLFEHCHTKVSNYAISFALLNGHLNVIKYLYETCHAKISYAEISKASFYGYLDIIKYLHETCHAEVPDDAISNASRNGHIDIVKYLYEQCRAEITEETIRNSKTEEIKNYFSSLFSDQPSDFESNILTASSKGNLASVQYLFERYHAKIPEYAIIFASLYGHLEVVKYLYETCNAKVPKYAINIATRNGYHDIVKYLQEHSIQD